MTPDEVLGALLYVGQPARMNMCRRCGCCWTFPLIVPSPALAGVSRRCPDCGDEREYGFRRDYTVGEFCEELGRLRRMTQGEREEEICRQRVP